METRIASEAAPGRPVNEDYAFALPRLVGVFDGVIAPAGLDTGYTITDLLTHRAKPIQLADWIANRPLGLLGIT